MTRTVGPSSSTATPECSKPGPAGATTCPRGTPAALGGADPSRRPSAPDREPRLRSRRAFRRLAGDPTTDRCSRRVRDSARRAPGTRRDRRGGNRRAAGHRCRRNTLVGRPGSPGTRSEGPSPSGSRTPSRRPPCWPRPTHGFGVHARTRGRDPVVCPCRGRRGDSPGLQREPRPAGRIDHRDRRPGRVDRPVPSPQLGEPDACPTTDLGLRRALRGVPTPTPSTSPRLAALAGARRDASLGGRRPRSGRGRSGSPRARLSSSGNGEY